MQTDTVTARTMTSAVLICPATTYIPHATTTIPVQHLINVIYFSSLAVTVHTTLKSHLRTDKSSEPIRFRI